MNINPWQYFLPVTTESSCVCYVYEIAFFQEHWHFAKDLRQSSLSSKRKNGYQWSLCQSINMWAQWFIYIYKYTDIYIPKCLCQKDLSFWKQWNNTSLFSARKLQVVCPWSNNITKPSYTVPKYSVGNRP